MVWARLVISDVYYGSRATELVATGAKCDVFGGISAGS